MTALAVFAATRQDQRAGGPGNADPGPAVVCGPVLAADRSGAVPDRPKTIRSWSLLLLAFPAAAEVWSGWVGIAQKTGFGQVSLLPGIWPSFRLDMSITLPVGVEAYAAWGARYAVVEDPDGNALGIMSPVDPDRRSDTDFGET